ncbi:hypothetical protein [Rubritalea tangerina]
MLAGSFYWGGNSVQRSGLAQKSVVRGRTQSVEFTLGVMVAYFLE